MTAATQMSVLPEMIASLVHGQQSAAAISAPAHRRGRQVTSEVVTTAKGIAHQRNAGRTVNGMKR